ncbi:Biofilm regulatory protein A precursor [Corynebacterium endometrii]|uniref:Biofilm regulatory protein A n=2 Tax=Corynebacterium endometrii TaxID=2488819 RepID=A0A4P7QE05_9CORY|nr:Biofilm regulatory protein A precursor [Corynebacterium endometrii]
MNSDNSAHSAPHRHSRDIQPSPTKAAPTQQKGGKPLKALVSVLSVMVLAFSAVGYLAIGRLGGEMASVGNLALGGGSGFKQDAVDGAMDILLVGSDSRTDAQGNPLSREELDSLNAGEAGGEENTDTIMLIRIPNDGSRATAVSIPRDTYVNEGELGNMKINGVFSTHKDMVVEQMTLENEEAVAAGNDAVHTDKEIEQEGTAAGRAALLDQIHSLTGIEVDHYAEIGLLGFVLLTDAVDGVEVCLNNDVNDPMSGADFKAGRQTISGAKALTFVRQRYGLPRGDLDRIVRQQAYMASLVNKMLDTGTLTNPSTLADVSKAVERSVVIDEGWDVMGFATQMAGLAGGNVTFSTIPVTSIDGVGDFGESIVTVDVDEVHAFMDDLARTEEETAAAQPSADDSEGNSAGITPVAEDINLQVLNAGSIAGLAAGVSGWLTGTGYNVENTGNAMPGVYWESQIVAADPTDERVVALAEQMGGLPVTANAELEPDTFIVITADDYAGPTDESSQAQASESAAAQPDPTNQVGTPGADFGTAEVAPEINAGGDGPRCVN